MGGYPPCCRLQGASGCSLSERALLDRSSGRFWIAAGASGQRALARFVESEQTTRLPLAPTHERGAQTNSRSMGRGADVAKQGGAAGSCPGCYLAGRFKEDAETAGVEVLALAVTLAYDDLRDAPSPRA